MLEDLARDLQRVAVYQLTGSSDSDDDIGEQEIASLADRQLSAFKADPANRGRTCRQGLWRWSRHPNYFFEWVHWLAYVPLAWGSSWWPATLLAPAIMLYLVTKVTGIPPTEAQSLRSRGEDYADYQRTTSAFFPWPPRPHTPMENGA